MSNKGSDKNVGSIEELIKEYKTYNDLDGIQDLSIYVNALEELLAELEQKDKRIKELEKALLKVKDKNTTLFITCRNSIPKQAVIDKICKYSDKIEKYNEYRVQGKETDVEYYENITNTAIVQVLQELLETK